MKATLRMLRWVGHEFARLAADRLASGVVVFGGGLVLILFSIAPPDVGVDATAGETWERALREPAALFSMLAGMIGANWLGGDLGYGILRQGILGGAKRTELLTVRLLTMPVVAMALAGTQLAGAAVAATVSPGIALPAPDAAGWTVLGLHVGRLCGFVLLGALFGALLRSPLLGVVAFLAWALVAEPGARVLLAPDVPGIEHALPARAFSAIGTAPTALHMGVASPGRVMRRSAPPGPNRPALPVLHGTLLAVLLGWRLLRRDL